MMAKSTPPTRPGRPKLSEIARYAKAPAGCVSTGWPKVRDQCSQFGVRFDDWQHGAGELIFAKRADGSYAASVGGVVISIPRQVGKTFLIGAVVFALCLLRPGLQVVWTAHHSATSGETFRTLKGFALRKKVAPHIHKVLEDDQWIEFKNGSRIMFGARERGFGRGFTNIGMLVFDEAQILSERALSDMVPTQNTAEHPLLFFMGTPPKPTDPSEAFTRKRAEVLAGEDEDTAYIEFSADQGCNPEDRKQWGKGNPSYPRRTPEAAMLRMKKNLTPESFMREGLGVWDDDAMVESVLTEWSGCADVGSSIVSHRQWAVSVSPDRKWASIGVAGRAADGRLHVEWVHHRAGTAWIVDQVVESWKVLQIPVRVHKTGPEGALIPKLVERGVAVIEVSTLELGQATGQVIDETDARTLVHVDQPSLNKAVAHAVLRVTSDGASVWSQKNSSIEITPLMAVTVAAGGVPALEMAAMFAYT